MGDPQVNRLREKDRRDADRLDALGRRIGRLEGALLALRDEVARLADGLDKTKKYIPNHPIYRKPGEFVG